MNIDLLTVDWKKVKEHPPLKFLAKRLQDEDMNDIGSPPEYYLEKAFTLWCDLLDKEFIQDYEFIRTLVPRDPEFVDKIQTLVPIRKGEEGGVHWIFLRFPELLDYLPRLTEILTGIVGEKLIRFELRKDCHYGCTSIWLDTFVPGKTEYEEIKRWEESLYHWDRESDVEGDSEYNQLCEQCEALDQRVAISFKRDYVGT